MALEATVARAEARRKCTGTGVATGGVGGGGGSSGGVAYMPNPLLDQLELGSYGEFGGRQLGEGGLRRTVDGKFYGRPR